jgi:hypothetical protein
MHGYLLSPFEAHYRPLIVIYYVLCSLQGGREWSFEGLFSAFLLCFVLPLLSGEEKNPAERPFVWGAWRGALVLDLALSSFASLPYEREGFVWGL